MRLNKFWGIFFLLLGKSTALVLAQPALSWAVADNDPVALLSLTPGPELNTPMLGEPYTPVVWAVLRGSQDALAVLLKEGADPNTRTAAGVPVLFLAAQAGRLDETQLLLAAGANPLLEDALGGTWLAAAAQGPSTDLVKEALARGLSPHQANVLGVTPLLKACQSGNLATVRLLVEKGADPLQSDYFGRTSLQMAKRAAVPELIKFLEPYFQAVPAVKNQSKTTRALR
ncbi:MAG: ankyrin repeat domain-containing protein [Spirochaetales bacterium]|nr:ankyrin repeat domain-containing protein [Spirochaetales bacterium]